MRSVPGVVEIRERCQPPELDVCFWRRAWVRKVSAHLTRLFIAAGCSANCVSILKGLVACFGAFLFSTGETVPAVAGALLLQFAFVLDACDGEVARFNGTCTTAGGEYVDKLGDLFSRGLFYAGWSFGVFRQTGHPGILACGMVVSACWLAVRFSVIETVLENISSHPETPPVEGERAALRKLFVREPASGSFEFFLSTFFHPWANLALLASLSYLNRAAATVFLLLYCIMWLLNTARKFISGYRISNFQRRDR